KFVDGCPVGDVGSVAMKGEESELGVVMGNPPRVQLDTVGGCEPNVLNRERPGMPVAVQAVRVIWEKDQARFENADKRQDQEIADENCKKEAQEAAAKVFL